MPIHKYDGPQLRDAREKAGLQPGQVVGKCLTQALSKKTIYVSIELIGMIERNGPYNRMEDSEGLDWDGTNQSLYQYLRALNIEPGPLDEVEELVWLRAWRDAAVYDLDSRLEWVVAGCLQHNEWNWIADTALANYRRDNAVGEK